MLTHGFTEGFFQDLYLASIAETELGVTDDSVVEQAAAIVASPDQSAVVYETQQQTAGIVQTEQSTGTDMLAAKAVPQTDAATATDVHIELFKHLWLVDVDSVAGIDAEALGVALADYEDFVYIEFGSPDSLGEFDDAGYGELTQLVEAMFNSTDTGSGAETAHTLVVSDLDIANTEHTELLATSITSSEQSSTTEYGLVQASFVDTDSAGHTDNYVLVAEFYEYDTIVTLESAGITSTLVSSDIAVAADIAELLISSHDIVATTELALLNAAVTNLDFAAGTEEEFIGISGEQSIDSDPYYPYVLLSRPWHYWRLGELDGTVVHDKRGRSNGIYTGPIETERGVLAGRNHSAVFDGADYAIFGDVHIDWTAATIELWIDGVGTAISKDGELALATDGSSIELTVFDGIAQTLEVPFERGYVVITAESGRVLLYTNGVLRGELEAFVQDTFGGLVVGEGFVGQLDDLAIYNRLLTEQEQQLHLLHGTLFESVEYSMHELAPVFYASYRTGLQDPEVFDDLDAAANIIDVVGPRKPLAAENKAIWSGPGQYVQYANTNGIYNNEYLELTIGGWINWNGDDTVYLFYHQNNLQLRVLSTGELRLTYYDPNTGSALNRTTTAVLTPGEWSFVAAVCTASETKLYINNVLVSTLSALPSLDMTRAGYFRIGAGAGSGAFAELFLLDRALTAYELDHLYSLVWHGRDDATVTSDTAVVVQETKFDAFVYEQPMLVA